MGNAIEELAHFVGGTPWGNILADLRPDPATIEGIEVATYCLAANTRASDPTSAHARAGWPGVGKMPDPPRASSPVSP